jgi:hypothetical protein
MKVIIFILALFFFFPSAVDAHSGRTNSSGCHNCNVGSCAGTYHCHGGDTGGYSGGYVAPVYTPPKPRPSNPTTGTVNFSTSPQNWCNHDISFNWSGATLANGYSVSLSKTAGADPGPKADTTETSYQFKNVESGKWYINLKALNSINGTYANQVTYWDVTLPKIEPNFGVSIHNPEGFVSYKFECLSKVEGPEFLMTSLREHNNFPSGATDVVPFGQPQTFTIKGWDKMGKQYEKTLTYDPTLATPTAQETKAVAQVASDNTSADVSGWFALGVLGTLVAIPSAFILWIRDKWRKRTK